MSDVIPIDKEDIPYMFDIELEQEIFTFEINYNSRFDFFTVDLIRNGEVLAYGEKLVYGQPLFKSYATNLFPKVKITPKAVGGNVETITYTNFYETVFLYIEGN